MATPCGYQQITIAAAAKSLTPPTTAQQLPVYCIFIAEAQAIRYRDDGTAPTATVGMPIAISQPVRYDGDLKKIQFMEQVAGGIVNIQYYY